jgi:hypothetical protein
VLLVVRFKAMTTIQVVALPKGQDRRQELREAIEAIHGELHHARHAFKETAEAFADEALEGNTQRSVIKGDLTRLRRRVVDLEGELKAARREMRLSYYRTL